MAADETIRQAEFAAEDADFVLEQFAQRFDKLHVHALGQAADIVVALDGDRGAAGEGDGFDDVRIERALGQEFGAAELLSLFLEDFDEQAPDDLALGFGIGLAFELAEEFLRRIDMDQRDIKLIAEHGDDLFAFVQAHQAVIDIDTGELIADGFVDQHRRDRRVDAAGKTTDDAARADLIANLFDHLLAIGGHGPSRLDAADLVHEIGIELGAVGRVHDFRVELHGPDAALLIGDHGEGRIRRGADDLKALGQRDDAVAMAHPDLVLGADIPDALGQRVGLLQGQLGPAEFAVMAGFDLATQRHAQSLLAIANPQDRHIGVEDRLVDGGGVLVQRRGRTAREHNALGIERCHGCACRLEGMDFAIHAGFADAARNQLRDLRSEVDDENGVGAGGGVWVQHGEALAPPWGFRKCDVGQDCYAPGLSSAIDRLR